MSKSTVAYHFRRLGSHPIDRFSRRYDWEAIQAATTPDSSRAECARAFRVQRATWFQAVVAATFRPGRERCRSRSCSSTIDGRRVAPISSCGCWRGAEGEPLRACGLTEWLGQPLKMQLHHVNGDGRDNRFENIVSSVRTAIADRELGRPKRSPRPRSARDCQRRSRCDETARPGVVIPASGNNSFVTLSTPWTSISAGASLR